MSTLVMDRPKIRNMSGGIGTDGMAQVVLYNDNVNSFDHVIECLMATFGHSVAIAIKLAKEAHTSGRTVAEVEEMELAIQHKEALVSAGLTAEVEKI